VSLDDLGKALVGFGLLIVAIGLVLLLAGRVPWIGRLPGDIWVQRGHWSFYFPLATSLLVSLLLTLFFWVINRR
jgi:tellurite resistance protein TehA-like permease